METEGLIKKPLSVLDMGCGIGLFGDKVKVHCGLLHGVDISNQMLDVVRSKGAYDFLQHEGIPEYLSFPKNQLKSFKKRGAKNFKANFTIKA